MAPTSIRALYGISDTRNATHGSGKVTFHFGLSLAKKKTWHRLVIRSELKPKPVECSGAQTFRRCWRSGRLIRMFTRISDVSCVIGRFSYDLEMIAREQKRNNKRTETERFDWFIERIQTRVAFGWLSERSGEKTSCPRTF